MKLLDWMIANGVGRNDVAEAIGVSDVSVGRYISGERVPRPEIVLKIKIMTENAVTADDFLPAPKRAAA